MSTASANSGTDLQVRAKQLAGRAVAAVKALSPATRIVAVVAILIVGVGGFVFIRWAASPTYAPLFSNLAGPDASAVIDKLNASGVSYQLSGDGTEILVPQDQVYAQRIALSADGLPSSPESGYSLLDDEGVTTSEFRQRLDYQRALEGELDNTIGAIEGVQQATVHLAMPAQDVFDDGTQKTTASVLLVLDRGASVSAQQVTAVVNLVASSVPGLSPDDITVTDASGRVLSAGGDAAGSGAADQAVSSYEQRMTQNLQTLLDNLVGPGHALVSVTAQLDPSKSSTTSRTYTSSPGAPPIAQSTTSESYSGSGGTAAGGVAGVAATPAATGTSSTTGSGNGSYTKTTNTQNNAVGTVDSTIETPPGQVQRLSVAVVIDSAVASSVSTSAVTDLVTSAAGVDTNRGDSLSVQQMAIDHTTADQAQAAADAATKAASKASATRQLITLGVSGLIGLILLTAVIGLWARRRHRRDPEGNSDQYELLIPPADQDPPPPEPEPLVPDRPWSEQSLDATRKELHNLAVDKPGDVARVLRSWLSD